MTQIFSIDRGVKSVVELRRSHTTRRVYRREDLLRLRNSPQSRILPPDFDVFARIKKELYVGALSGVVEAIPKRYNNYKAYGNEFNNTVRSVMRRTKTSIELCDSAIVRAQRSLRKPSVITDVEQRVEVNYPAKSQIFSRDDSWVDHKPEWYVNGPSVVEDHMDLQGCNTLSRDDKENESSSEHISPHYLAVEHEYADRHSKELEDYLKSLLLHNNKKEGRKQGERPLNIRTLREIEAKLEDKPSEPSARGDMSAFYKLLGLFDQISKSNNVTSQDKGNQNVDVIVDHSDFTDNKVGISDGTHNILSQPNLINSDAGNLDTEVVSVSNKGSICRTPKLEVSNITKHVTCNPVTAPYQRQFIASGPLGQNALRWFKAMTNAASANACINHNLENFKTLHSKPSTPANVSTSVQVGNASPSEISISCSLPAYQNLLINSYCERNEQTKLPGQPFEGLLGFGYPNRSIKSMILPYQSHSALFFNRSIVNPFLLQQLIQKQLSFRSAAFQLPYQYFRTHFSELPSGNFYASFSQSSPNIPETKKVCWKSTPNRCMECCPSVIDSNIK